MKNNNAIGNLLGLIVVIVTVICLWIFSANYRTKNWGGKMNIKLPENTKLINASWKNSDLWILVQDTTTHEIKMLENSTYGVFEGQITFKNK